jgi:hypothetical protein
LATAKTQKSWLSLHVQQFVTDIQMGMDLPGYEFVAEHYIH